VVQDLGEEDRLRVDTAVCDRSERVRQLQVGNTFCNTAESGRGVVIAVRQGGDPEVSRVFHAELRCHSLDHTAHGNDIHGVDDTVTDRTVAHIAFAAVPVPECLCSHRVRSIIIDTSEGSSACIDRRSEGCDDLESRSRLAERVCRTV